MILCGLLIMYATSFDTDHIHKCRCLILIQIVRHSGGVIEFSDLYFFIYIIVFSTKPADEKNHAKSKINKK